MSSHIMVREHGEIIPISAKAVLRVEGDGEYVHVHLKNGKVFKDQVGSIGNWDKELAALTCFVKIARSHIVNYHRVVSFSIKSGVRLCLCAVREYEKILALPPGEEKIHTVRKNTILLPLNAEGFVKLKLRFCAENGSTLPVQ